MSPRAAVRPYVEQRCREMRSALLDARSITPEELAPYWPGGAENPDQSVIGWVYCYGILGRFTGRAEARQEFTHGAHAGRTAGVVSTLQQAPRVVPLAVPVQDGETMIDRVALRFKAWSPCLAMAVLARQATQLLDYIRQLDAFPEHAELVREAHAWRDQIAQQLVWGAVSDAPNGEGYGIPWHPITNPWPVIPAWIGTLSVTDRVLIQTTFAEMHARALLEMTPFLEGDADSDPLGGWHTFFATYAVEHGMEAEALMSTRPFAPFLTQLSLAAHSARAARKAAEEKAPPTPGPT
jgi:hypothetical protein